MHEAASNPPTPLPLEPTPTPKHSTLTHNAKSLTTIAITLTFFLAILHLPNTPTVPKMQETRPPASSLLTINLPQRFKRPNEKAYDYQYKIRASANGKSNPPVPSPAVMNSKGPIQIPEVRAWTQASVPNVNGPHAPVTSLCMSSLTTDLETMVPFGQEIACMYEIRDNLLDCIIDAIESTDAEYKKIADNNIAEWFSMGDKWAVDPSCPVTLPPFVCKILADRGLLPLNTKYLKNAADVSPSSSCVSDPNVTACLSMINCLSAAIYKGDIPYHFQITRAHTLTEIINTPELGNFFPPLKQSSPNIIPLTLVPKAAALGLVPYGYLENPQAYQTVTKPYQSTHNPHVPLLTNPHHLFTQPNHTTCAMYPSIANHPTLLHTTQPDNNKRLSRTTIQLTHPVCLQYLKNPALGSTIYISFQQMNGISYEKINEIGGPDVLKTSPAKDDFKTFIEKHNIPPVTYATPDWNLAK